MSASGDPAKQPEPVVTITSAETGDATDQELRGAYVRERELLLGGYLQHLAEAHPARHEAVWEEFADEWARLARQYDAGRFGLRILAYCTEWDPHKGGIVAVNRSLVEGLAAAGHEVFVRVGHEVPAEAPSERIHLIGPPRYDPDRSEQEQLVYDGEDLPSEVDAIIGHSRYSGPEGLKVRDELFPDTPFIQVVHMVTGALARVANRPDLEVEFEGIERRMVAAADIVVAVGPVLVEEARRLVATNPGGHVPAIHQIIPGVPFEEQQLLPWDEDRTRHVLLIGRADAPQEGAHHAALMVRQLLKEGIDVQLTVRGAAPETVEEVRDRLSNIAGREVVVKPFTIERSDILADMRQADVVVMPSRAEGFGLVGLEAAGAGLPVLLPASSGVGAFFGDPDLFPSEITRRSLVEQGFEDEIDLTRWSDKLREILLDLPTVRENALTLQRLLREGNTTWVGAAESLAAAIQAMPDTRASPPQAPTLPALEGDAWVNCAQGHAHWGRFGAAGLLPVHRDTDGEVHVLMHHRGTDTDQGGTWALLGGARGGNESAAEAAIREAAEESDLDPVHFHAERVVRDDHGGWSYDTVIVSVDQRVPVQPVKGESLALAWVPLSKVESLNLHSGFASSWPNVRAELDAVLNGEPPATSVAVPTPSTSALPLPPHPVTSAQVVARQALNYGDRVTNRELATFDDGTRAIYEKFVRTEDAWTKVLDAYVGRAVGARVPLAHPVGLREVYTDHMPGEPATTRYQDLADLANQGVPATRDGVFLGLYFTLTATQGVTADQLFLGEQQSLIAVGDSAPSHGLLPDIANPFVGTFYRQVKPHVLAWVGNPIPTTDFAIMRRQLDGLRPLFERFDRLDLHNVVMDRFDEAEAHATGTDPLLPRSPGHQVTLPDARTVRHYVPPPPPLGSQARIEFQQISEALLTDDGRITDTSQAKTIAIQAIAERMRPSTPELALAGLGLVIGTDMVHRLGDGNYVLVPHHEQYPSIGADLFHVDELDPDSPRHALDKVVRMDDPHAETLVRWIAVSEVMGSWSYGSNNNVRVLALQEAAKEEFGLSGVLDWRMDPKTRAAVDVELDYNRDALQAFLRTQYELTQEILADRGITEVLAYRALTWQEGAARPEWFGLDIGDTFEIPHRPLSSWSADRQVVADWLEKRGGHAVILVNRKPAEDVLSLPMTGMGFLVQKEWVALPGDGMVTLDGIFASKAPANAAEQTAASSVTIGGPALSEAAATLSNDMAATPAVPYPSGRWQPLTITTPPDPANPFDQRLNRILDGEEGFPGWWPQDDSGYTITRRDLDFLGINPIQVRWMLTGEAPLGMTPELYQRFGTEMLEALHRDGIEALQVEIRLKGTGAEFFAGLHKMFPRQEDLASNPGAVEHMREWFGDSQERPLRRPYDCMWRLGLEPVPSDLDLDFASTPMTRVARTFWKAHHSDQYPGDFMGGHGYINKETVKGAFPALSEWQSRWEEALGRPLSPGVFESSGPFNATMLGRALSSHFSDTDWIVHSPNRPMAWRTPRSRITDLADSPSAQGRSGDVAPESATGIVSLAYPQGVQGNLNRTRQTPQPRPRRSSEHQRDDPTLGR